MENSNKIVLGAVIIGFAFIASMVTVFKPDPEPIVLPISIEEFSDFQCPACRAYFTTVNTLKESFGEDINFDYKHFPLEVLHDRAYSAAVASEAAREQGKFEEYHDILFTNQANLSDDAFIEYAEQLNLDTNVFRNDYENNQTLKDRVDMSMQEGEERGVNSTPSFFINGEKFSPSNPDHLMRHIAEIISTAKELDTTSEE